MTLKIISQSYKVHDNRGNQDFEVDEEIPVPPLAIIKSIECLLTVNDISTLNAIRPLRIRVRLRDTTDNKFYFTFIPFKFIHEAHLPSGNAQAGKQANFVGNFRIPPITTMVIHIEGFNISTGTDMSAGSPTQLTDLEVNILIDEQRGSRFRFN